MNCKFYTNSGASISVALGTSTLRFNAILHTCASEGMSVYQAGVDISKGHYKAAGVHTLDAVMGVVGTFGGPVGWAVSGAYFISRFWWGDAEEEEGGSNE